MTKLTESHAKQIAQAMIRKHIFGWKFAFNNRVGAIGTCDHQKKTIFFSRKYLHEGLDQFKQTILHEIAHALTPGHGHDDVWKEQAHKLGVREPKSVAQGVTKVPGRWFMHCEPCDHTYGKSYHTRHAVIKRRCCHMCKGSLVYKEKR